MTRPNTTAPTAPTDGKLPSDRSLWVIGMTASGKSALAVELAKHYHGEIISADSMQIYRQLDAGTAKPSLADRRQVPHHLIDVVEPTEPFTVADWTALTQSHMTTLQAAGKLPLIVGGTNLYLKALLEGMFKGPGSDEAFRQQLAPQTNEQLYAELRRVDPIASERIHRNDRKRLVRALEVYHLTGRPISDHQTQWQPPAPGNPTAPGTPGSPSTPDNSTPAPKSPPAEHLAAETTTAPPSQRLLIGLRWSVEAINQRINQRVKPMIEPPQGVENLVDETKRLLASDQLGPQAREAIGTRQAIDYLEGRLTHKQMVERIKIATRRFAKAQRTWLKRYQNVHWIDAEANSFDDCVAQAIDYIDQQWPTD